VTKQYEMVKRKLASASCALN